MNENKFEYGYRTIEMYNPMLDAAMIYIGKGDVELYREKSLRDQRIYPDGTITSLSAPIIKKEKEMNNEERYGSFWGYVSKNKQKRGLGIFIHGFTLAWGLVSGIDGAPVFVSLLPLVFVGSYWIMSWLNYTEKHV